MKKYYEIVQCDKCRIEIKEIHAKDDNIINRCIILAPTPFAALENFMRGQSKDTLTQKFN